VATVDSHLDNASTLAIGQLLAAAPELLEACRYTNRTIKKLDFTEDRDEANTMLNRVRKAYVYPAITKAVEEEDDE